MKNICLAIVAICFLYSCKNKTKKPSTSPVISSITVLNTPNTGKQKEVLLQKFKPILEGNWVIQNYINYIAKTRSPFASQKKLEGVACIAIESKNATIDTLDAGISLNNHEGSSFTIYFIPGLKPNSLKTSLPDYKNKANFYELGYITKNANTSLVLYHYNKKNKLIDSVNYTKVNDIVSWNMNMGSGIDYITNEILFTGKYDLIGLGGQVSTVDFNNEGKVSGFLTFSDYYATDDFMAGPDNNLDCITFDPSTPLSSDMGYKFDKDTLKLYELKHSADSTELILGSVRYRLVKRK